MMEVLQMIPGVSHLSIESVEKYLLQEGWSKGTTTNPNAIIYEGPLWDIYGNPLTVVLPARRSLSDADRRINDVIRTVASIEEKSPESLVAAIARGGTRRRIAPRLASPRKVIRVQAINHSNAKV